MQPISPLPADFPEIVDKLKGRLGLTPQEKNPNKSQGGGEETGPLATTDGWNESEPYGPVRTMLSSRLQ